MHIFKALIIAFSIYSRIPMPQFQWKDEDMRYMLCFFPWVGAVIGGVFYGWLRFCGAYQVGEVGRATTSVAIPLLITGGFHVDGFMDTMDAFHSYQPREKKLAILKDSHIGAFSVIMLLLYGLIFLGACSELKEQVLINIVCAGFCLSRCLSGISVVSFPAAKKDGMLYQFASSAQKRVVKGVLWLEVLVCIGFMVAQSFVFGVVILFAALLSFGYYFYRCKKELGGITGDTAGYFILLCEGSMVVVAALMDVVM